MDNESVVRSAALRGLLHGFLDDTVRLGACLGAWTKGDMPHNLAARCAMDAAVEELTRDLLELVRQHVLAPPEDG